MVVLLRTHQALIVDGMPPNIQKASTTLYPLIIPPYPSIVSVSASTDSQQFQDSTEPQNDLPSRRLSLPRPRPGSVPFLAGAFEICQPETWSQLGIVALTRNVPPLLHEGFCRTSGNGFREMFSILSPSGGRAAKLGDTGSFAALDASHFDGGGVCKPLSLSLAELMTSSWQS